MRRMARFSAPLSQRFLARSSSKVMSNARRKLFSIARCARTMAANASGARRAELAEWRTAWMVRPSCLDAGDGGEPRHHGLNRIATTGAKTVQIVACPVAQLDAAMVGVRRHEGRQRRGQVGAAGGDLGLHRRAVVIRREEMFAALRPHEGRGPRLGHEWRRRSPAYRRAPASRPAPGSLGSRISLSPRRRPAARSSAARRSRRR